MSVFFSIKNVLSIVCFAILTISNIAQAARLARSHSRIVNGVNVTPMNKYPMIVSFHRDGKSVNCTGTIFNKYYILTSAYCAERVAREPQLYYVLAGIYYLGDPDPQYLQNISIKSATAHTRFGDPTKGQFANDVGVVRLRMPLVWNDHVTPTNLPKPGWTVLPNTEANATAIGWGTGENGTFPYYPIRPLQEVELPLLTTEACQREATSYQVTDFEVCIEPVGRAGPCDGDLGSPLFVYNAEDDKHVQIGINTWSDGFCGTEERDPAPSGWTKVSKFVHWTEEAIRECNLPRSF